jgi:hypothetical protein
MGDVQGLAGTKNWTDVRSVARYSHVVPRDEWGRVDSLPDLGDNGEKRSMSETLKHYQWADLPS